VGFMGYVNYISVKLLKKKNKKIKMSIVLKYSYKATEPQST
jgi:hypothetical protein